MKNNSHTMKLAYKAANLAYHHSDYKIDVRCQAALGKDWITLSSSTLLPKCQNHGFRGVAFMNLADKQVIISCSGTRIEKKDGIINSILDFAANLSIANGYIPKQFHNDAAIFANHIYEFTQSIDPNFEYITTGHSLGGANAQLLGIHLANKTKNVSSITFDQPGISGLLNEYEEYYGLAVDLKAVEDKFTIVNSSMPNFINSCGKQFGKVFTADFGQKTNNNILSDLANQLQEHSLKNFSAPIKNGTINYEPDWNDNSYSFNGIFSAVSDIASSVFEYEWY